MRRVWMMALTALLMAVPTWAGASRDVAETFELRSSDRVRVDFEVGELRIEAWDGGEVTVELDLRCKKSSASCERRLEEVEIEAEWRKGRLELSFSGLDKRISNKMEVEAIIRIPRTVELTVDMGIGDLDIEGVTRDIFVDMGIGDVSVTIPEASARSVYLDAGIGEAQIWGSSGRVDASRPFLIGSEVEWNAGEGGAEIVIDLGIGEISVHLD